MNEQQHTENRRADINVAVLGATGLVGQVFVHLLSNHQQFNLAVIAGSERRAGKLYTDEVQWSLPFPIPGNIKGRVLDSVDIKRLKEAGVKIVFSALPSDVAKNIEPELRDCGFYVFSNASALRYEQDVPILIPEANPEALEDIKAQGFPHNGFVVTNANCSTTGLAVALAPLRQFGIEEVFVSTYQSISGAGYPGLSAMDILNNAIPFIKNEEEKMVVELKKILHLEADIFPHCVRIPVPFGHLETVWLTFKHPVAEEEIKEAWSSFGKEESLSRCPSSAARPVHFLEDEGFPRPGNSFWGSPPGMEVFTGRLRNISGKTGFSLLVNNLVKGAAGGSIQNAELFVDSFGAVIGTQYS